VVPTTILSCCHWERVSRRIAWIVEPPAFLLSLPNARATSDSRWSPSFLRVRGYLVRGDDNLAHANLAPGSRLDPWAKLAVPTTEGESQ